MKCRMCVPQSAVWCSSAQQDWAGSMAEVRANQQHPTSLRATNCCRAWPRGNHLVLMESNSCGIVKAGRDLCKSMKASHSTWDFTLVAIIDFKWLLLYFFLSSYLIIVSLMLFVLYVPGKSHMARLEQGHHINRFTHIHSGCMHPHPCCQCITSTIMIKSTQSPNNFI